MTEEKDKSGRPWMVTWGALISTIPLGFLVIGGAVAILNWLYAENNRLRAEIMGTRIEFVREQVTKTEFKEALRELGSRIDVRMDRLEGRLSQRDRP